MPEDHGQTRQVRISRQVILSGCTVLFFLGAFSALYFLSVKTGNGWLPGGSLLQKENRVLSGQIALLESNVGSLRDEIDDVYEVQQQVAMAVNLPAVDEVTFAAGIGGRSPLELVDVEVPGLNRINESGSGYGELDQELQRMVRQARIQMHQSVVH